MRVCRLYCTWLPQSSWHSVITTRKQQCVREANYEVSEWTFETTHRKTLNIMNYKPQKGVDFIIWRISLFPHVMTWLYNCLPPPIWSLGVQQGALSQEPVETVGGGVLLEEIGNAFSSKGIWSWPLIWACLMGFLLLLWHAESQLLLPTMDSSLSYLLKCWNPKPKYLSGILS